MTKSIREALSKVEVTDEMLLGDKSLFLDKYEIEYIVRLFRSWVLEMIDLLDEFSRIEITHKDGSKSIAILESQIETWKKVVKEKVGE